MKSNFKSVSARRRARGFTLIEAIVVIVLIGIVGGMVAVFMKTPIDAYTDTERRGELVAIADSASRFMAREIQNAVPNSVRLTTSGSTSYLEFVPIFSAGRYPTERNADNKGNYLDFDEASDPLGFDVLPTLPAFNCNPPLSKTTHVLVVGNLGQPGVSSVYETGTAGSTQRKFSICLLPQLGFASNGFKLPNPSPGSRFQMAAKPITYECVPGSGRAGRINRYTGYQFNATQPTSSLGTPSLVADKVSACSFTYQATQQMLGLVTIRLDISADGESVRLQTQVNVDNAP